MFTKTDDLLKLIKRGQLDEYDTKTLLRELKEDGRYEKSTFIRRNIEKCKGRE